jgi:hypothetical protein
LPFIANYETYETWCFSIAISGSAFDLVDDLLGLIDPVKLS